MQVSDTARVGVTVLVALVLLAALSLSLRATMMRTGTYTRRVVAQNAQGIQAGAAVRVRGVDMGTVDRVGLGPNHRALLTLRISSDYIVQPDDDIRIIGGMMGFAPPHVEITPGGRDSPLTVRIDDEEVLVADSVADTERLMQEGERLMANLNDLTQRMMGLTDSLTAVVDDPALRQNFRQTAANLEQLTRSGIVLSQNLDRTLGQVDVLVRDFGQTSTEMRATMRQAGTTVERFGGAADDTRLLMQDARALIEDTRGTVTGVGDVFVDVRGALGEGRVQVAQALEALSGSLRRLDATLDETQRFIADPQIRADLQATAQNVREATGTLRDIAQDVRGLTGDPEVQEDLRETISGLRDATEDAQFLLRRARDVVGAGAAARSVGARLGDTEFDAVLSRTTRTNRTRIDFDATIPWTDESFFRLGFYDFSERNRFNVQYGQQIRPGTWLRYGVRASRLGVGLDLGGRRWPTLGIDVFGVDRPQVDVRTNVRLTPSLDLSIGLDNALRQPDPLFGVRYRF
jgi:phospholipid/cholesterol/gamma-HCH transport system substrate-binding protein